MKKVNIVTENEFMGLVYDWRKKSKDVPNELYLSQDIDDCYLAADNTTGIH